MSSTIKIRNNGPDDAPSTMVVFSTVDGSIVQLNASPSVGAFSDNIWYVGDLAVGDELSITVSAEVVESVRMQARVYSSVADHHSLNNTIDFVIGGDSGEVEIICEVYNGDFRPGGTPMAFQISTDPTVETAEIWDNGVLVEEDITVLFAYAADDSMMFPDIGTTPAGISSDIKITSITESEVRSGGNPYRTLGFNIATDAFSSIGWAMAELVFHRSNGETYRTISTDMASGQWEGLRQISFFFWVWGDGDEIDESYLVPDWVWEERTQVCVVVSVTAPY